MHDIFLSYSRDDLEVARLVADALQGAGFGVWWDQSLNAGEAYDHVTEQALKTAKAVVVLWSKKSVASRWVRAEATLADRNKTLVPVMIEACERPIMFELTQAAELMHWRGDANDKAWQNFVSGLQKFVNKAPVATSRSQVSSTATALSPPRKTTHWITLSSAALLVVGMAAWALLRPGNSTEPAPAAVATPEEPMASVDNGQAVMEEKSIAVLPFRDLSPAADQLWFADGISEEVSNLLTRVEDLLVINTNSSFQFREQEQNFQTIRDALKVAYLLSGSVRRAGDELRVTVQLSSTFNGSVLWSDNYAGVVSDVFEMQETIATAVSQALQITLATGTFGRTPGMTRNVEAYENYLGARTNTRPPGTNAADYIRGRLEQLEEALLLDPGFSSASAVIAAIYLNSVANNAALTDFPERERRLAEALAHVRAVDPNDPTLWVLESVQLIQQRNWLAAEQALARATAGFLDLGLAQSVVGDPKPTLLRAVGRINEAINETERHRVRNPLIPDIYQTLVELLAMSGDIERALAVDAEGLALPGQATHLALRGSRLVILLAQGDHERIAAFRDQAPDDAGGGSTNRDMIDLLEQPETALQELRRRAESPELASQSLGVLAAWAAFYDDPQFALELLQRSFELSTIQVGFIYRPLYADMRKLPGFKQLVTELGLVDYWRATGNWGDFCRPLPNTENDFECF